MRPDFGSGLLALVFEPNSTTLAATTQMLVQSALQQHLAHLIAVQAVEVETDRRHLQVTVRYVGAGATAPCDSTASRRRGAAHDLPLLRPAPARGAAPLRHRERHRVPRGARPRGAARRAARSRRCSCACCAPGFTLTPDNLRINGGERIPTVGIEWVAPAERAAAAGRARPGRRRRRPAAHAGRPHRQQRRLLALHAGDRRQLRQRPAAGRLRSAAVVDRVLVQGRVPVGLRLRARRCRARRRRADAPRHRLPGEGLPGLPPPDARPPEPARAGLDRALGRRRRRHAGRAARLRGRQPVATARTRSPTRPISPPRASASRCAATRGWSTTACTKAATRAPACTSRSPRAQAIRRCRAARRC